MCVDVKPHQGWALWTHPIFRFLISNYLLINTIMPKYVILTMLHTLLSLFMLQEGYMFMELTFVYAYWVFDIV